MDEEWRSYVFFSSDEYIKCLCADQSGKKLDKKHGQKEFDFYADLYGKDGKKGTNDPKTTAKNYLAWCEESGRLPERAYKGSFNVRIGQDLHRKIAMYAVEKEISLNGLVETALQEYVVREEQKQYSCSR